MPGSPATRPDPETSRRLGLVVVERHATDQALGVCPVIERSLGVVGRQILGERVLLGEGLLDEIVEIANMFAYRVDRSRIPAASAWTRDIAPTILDLLGMPRPDAARKSPPGW